MNSASRCLAGAIAAMDEMRNYIDWAVKTVLALVERGLKVEIRVLPPPVHEGAEEGEEVEPPPQFAQLKEIVPQLVFPPVEGMPVLELPSPLPEAEPQAEPEPKPKARAKRAPRKPRAQ